MQHTTSVACRMRHPDGIAQMLDQMRMHFPLPPGRDAHGNPARQASLFKRFIYLSQAGPVTARLLAEQPA